jgi:FkbH-like protein
MNTRAENFPVGSVMARAGWVGAGSTATPGLTNTPQATAGAGGDTGSFTVAATFTADALEPSLGLLMREAGLGLTVAFAPYHQVFQELLTPHSAIGSNAQGVNVLLVRLEDFIRDVPDLEPARALLKRSTDDLLTAARQNAQRTRVPTIYWVPTPSPAAPAALLSDLTALTAELVASLRPLPGTLVIESADTDPLCRGERHDTLGDELAHLPYTEEYFAALALALVRKAHALLVPTHKVLVLDCDNTVWRGVVGEDGPLGISVPEELARLQDFAVKVQSEGTLVCLASKNAEADVMEVFEKRTDMRLLPEHLVAHRINWEPKPRNLASLAQALNLGLDSFVFIDDNPVECAQMRAELPQVVTLQLPADQHVAGFLDHLWTFDRVSVTEEDLRRTRMYRENAAREALETSASDIGDFIASLEMTIDIGSPADDEWPRVSQLTQKTNQFNFTTVRRTEVEMRALAAAGHTILSVHVRDRFGDYGLVGVVVAAPANGAMTVDTFLLSCRVLGRGVEHALMRRLGELAQAAGLPLVRLPYARTAKNEPARAFAEHVAGAYALPQGADICFDIPTAHALAIQHQPGADPEAVVEARRSDAKKPAPKAADNSIARSERYTRLALELTSGQAVLDAVRSESARSRSLQGASVQPATETERQLLALWERTLMVSGLGVEDDYFAVGGTSLLAARLFADITRQFGVTLPLTSIVEAPTVRGLARRIAGDASEPSGGLVPLKAGGPRQLFLVHDGDGETLLYRNLARRLPDNIGIFGLQPTRAPGVPLAHDSIAGMAAHYVAELRRQQPHGPYLLGGMCAGGLIAYEMANQLLRDGERVDLVAIMDAATPQAAKKPGLMTQHRAGRVQQAVKAAFDERGPVFGAIAAAGIVARKIIGAASYEVRRRLTERSTRQRFALLHDVLHQGKTWPAQVVPLTVREIFNSAEARYTPPSLDVPTVLVRARQGIDGDRPYIEIYADPTLGWQSVARRLAVVDVDGGHASMLQEPFAESLVAALTPHLESQRA